MCNPILGRMRIACGTFLVTAVITSPSNLLFADVVGEGDVSPNGPIDLPIDGGTATADVVVGDTDVGILTIDVPAFTDPLESPNGFIGASVTGIGRAIVTGFDLDRSEWIIRGGDLVVAGAGYGELQINSGARVTTATELDMDGMPTGTIGDAIVGEDFGSQGIVSINGFASTLSVDDITVGEYGAATVNLASGGIMRSINTIVGENLNGKGTISLSGFGTRWLNEEDVMLGVAGAGILELNSEAVAFLGEIDSTPTGGENFVDGTTNIGPLGRVEMFGGELWTYDLTNSGLIRGEGWLQPTNSFVITLNGELRNAASVANLRERLYVADPTVTVENNGTIQSLGGEMEFEGPVTNNFELVARDAFMRFNNGVTNTGTVSIGGDTTLHGTIVNTGGGIFVLSDSESLLVGDLIFSGSSILGLTAGPADGTLDVTGMADLTGAIISLDYSAGIEPQTGDSYQIFQADGGIANFANTTAAAGGIIWDIELIGTNTLFATATGAMAMPIGADFNGDGIVNVLDQNIWEQNFGSTGDPGTLDALGDADGDGDVDGADFFKIIMDLGGPPTPLVAASATVPEPSAVVLTLFALTMLLPRRVRC